MEEVVEFPNQEEEEEDIVSEESDPDFVLLFYFKCSYPGHFSCVWFDHERCAQDEGMFFFEGEVAWRFSLSASVLF
jgi:hypothetical protein